MMRWSLFVLLLFPAVLYAQTEEVRVDTLQEVLVTPNYTIPDMIDPFTRESARIGSRRHLLPPGVTDQILHPFAVKQRKQERHRRKMRKLLQQYDMIKTPNEELIEALQREGLYDELEQRRGASLAEPGKE